MSSYSDYWRKNRSRQQAVELALSLRALRKVAGHIGDGTKPVYWKGMAAADGHSILLDLDAIEERFPISVQDFDCLVGNVAFEELASIELSDRIRKTVQKRVTGLPPAAASFLDTFLQTAEAVYIDALAGSSVWSLYLSQVWKRTLSRTQRDWLLPPTTDSLLQAWGKKAILGGALEHRHPDYDAPLEILETHTPVLRALAGTGTPEERCGRRSDLYGQIWTALWEAVSGWQIFHADLDTVPESESPVDVAVDEKQELGTGAIDPVLADQISWILEEGEVDLTREILAAVQDPNARALETFLKNGAVLMDFQPDTAQVQRLRRIFKEHVAQVRRARHRNIRRGLLEGKLDPKRLYRVPIDGKTFKSRQAPGFDDLWQICIVADASASMAGEGGSMRPWRIAERSFATVIQAARHFRNRIDIYAYLGEPGKCMLTRLYHGNRLYTITPSGDTPSGQAIMAVAMLLDRKYRKSMIIHITDGAPNSGLPLQDAVNYCERNGIHVFTIGCGCTSFTQHFLKETFPSGCVYFMKSIDYLSEGLETLFNQHILRQGL